MKLEDLKMFLVRNSSGKFYRRVGREGYGSCWTDDLALAAVWTKQRTARSRVTYFANKYPTFPVPDLIEISAGTVTVLDQKERINKARAAKLREKARHEVWLQQEYIRAAQHKLVQAQQDMAVAEAKLNKLKGDTV